MTQPNQPENQILGIFAYGDMEMTPASEQPAAEPQDENKE